MRPESTAETSTAVAPDPADDEVVVEPYETELPYSTCQVVASALGLTAPATVTDVEVTVEAEPVVTTGAAASAWPAPKLSATTAAASSRPTTVTSLLVRMTSAPLSNP